FLFRLKQGSADVLDLLEYNPFPNRPPAYLRVQVFKYQFTSMEERERTGQWWKRDYLGQVPYARPRHP
ncbi:MAG: lipase maturation factor family protein, partial [Gammaproteobacteria bacterium]|nr:lipase maturation factor family protein [Gammaproteobacteria bacterium]